MRTDTVENFLLDRGFQVLLTAYPEACRALDYERLSLRSFYPGALVRSGGRFHKLADPFRHPLESIASLFSPIGTLADKLRVAKLRRRVQGDALEDLFKRPETTTIEALRAEEFSDSMIEKFFRPFFGGVFLESELRTSSRLFEFLFRMFSSGDTALPADGMSAIPEQLARTLPANSVRLQTQVARVEPRIVFLASGEKLSAEAIVIATEEPAVAKLLGRPPYPASFHGVTTIYFAAERAPLCEPILILNGEGSGIINNVCVPSAVAPSYAPSGAALIAISILDEQQQGDDNVLEETARAELRSWFGQTVSAWRHLRTYRIRYALPEQTSLPFDGNNSPARLQPGLYACSDHLDTASINGAMRSGRRAAEAIIKDFTQDQA